MFGGGGQSEVSGKVLTGEGREVTSSKLAVARRLISNETASQTTTFSSAFPHPSVSEDTSRLILCVQQR